MQPQVLLLVICLLVIALTAVLSISFYFERMQVCTREDNGPPYVRRRPRWISARNYQTFSRSDLDADLEAGPDSNNLPNPQETTTPEHARQPPRRAPPTRPGGGQGPSGLPKRPPPRTVYNYRHWDPEDGVIGVTYRHRDEEDKGKVLDEETARRIEEHERRINNPSPYDLEGVLARGGSLPVHIPNKRTERPTFPLPQKLIWQKRTPFEKAGSVWWCN